MADRNERAMRETLARDEARLAEIEIERARIARRIVELKARLSAGTPQASDPREPTLQNTLSSRSTPTTSKQKVSLFLELFRGRTDVYPKRWVNTKKGTKGYSPACANEWVRGVCEKPRVKCGECPSQAFIPVTEKTIHDHFRGRHVIGVYPMLEDEACSRCPFRTYLDSRATRCSWTRRGRHIRSNGLFSPPFAAWLLARSKRSSVMPRPMDRFWVRA
jgi:hypothetical protein